jgi:hypothetical protein
MDLHRVNDDLGIGRPGFPSAPLGVGKVGSVDVDRPCHLNDGLKYIRSCAHRARIVQVIEPLIEDEAGVAGGHIHIKISGRLPGY